MKAIVCLLFITVIAAKPFGGQYQWVYDHDSFEHSLEWIPSGRPTQFRSATTGNNPLPYYGASSEELFYMMANRNQGVPRTRAQKVGDLTRVLNSGYGGWLDSDEALFHVLNNPQSFFPSASGSAGATRGAGSGSGGAVEIAKKK